MAQSNRTPSRIVQASNDVPLQTEIQLSSLDSVSRGRGEFQPEPRLRRERWMMSTGARRGLAMGVLRPYTPDVYAAQTGVNGLGDEMIF